MKKSILIMCMFTLTSCLLVAADEPSATMPSVQEHEIVCTFNLDDPFSEDISMDFLNSFVPETPQDLSWEAKMRMFFILLAIKASEMKDAAQQKLSAAKQKAALHMADHQNAYIAATALCIATPIVIALYLKHRKTEA